VKSILAIAVLIIAVSPIVVCQTASKSVVRKSKAEREVLRLENERVQALLRGDTVALDRVYSDDYTVMSTIGLVKNKADVMQDFKSGNLKYESFTLDECKVRIYGNTAVVTGLSTQKARDKGQDISGQFYFTRVYVKQSGRWQIVANHQSRMARSRVNGEASAGRYLTDTAGGSTGLHFIKVSG
jgi:hypothetical protein